MKKFFLIFGLVALFWIPAPLPAAGSPSAIQVTVSQKSGERNLSPDYQTVDEEFVTLLLYMTSSLIGHIDHFQVDERFAGLNTERYLAPTLSFCLKTKTTQLADNYLNVANIMKLGVPKNLEYSVKKLESGCEAKHLQSGSAIEVDVDPIDMNLVDFIVGKLRTALSRDQINYFKVLPGKDSKNGFAFCVEYEESKNAQTTWDAFNTFWLEDQSQGKKGHATKSTSFSYELGDSCGEN